MAAASAAMLRFRALCKAAPSHPTNRSYISRWENFWIKQYTHQMMQTNIQFSNRAAAKVKGLIDGEGNPDLKLRVFVTGGGCSGFSYGFTFDEAVADDDATVATDGITMVVDSMSYQYLLGAEVDFQEDLNGARFVVTNPNAQATCGCGNSFAI